jgi:hypothetical protein
MTSLPVWTILGDARRQTARAGRALWVMWLVYTLLAVVVASATVASMGQHFGRSLSAGPLSVELDPAGVAEWIYANRGEPAWQLIWAVAAGLVVLLPATVFMAGGALGQLSSRTGFLEGGSRYFWRFLRLAVMAGVLHTTALAALAAVHRAVERAFVDSLVERPVVLTSEVIDGLVVLAVWLIAGAMDYAKVRIVVDEERSALSAGFAGLWFAARHPFRALGPLAFVALCGMVLFVFYQTAYNVFDYRGMRTILISLAGQQFYLGLRIWLRLWQWATCMRVDLAVRRPAAPWAISEPEPHGDNI